jgi:hypothetical protein
MHRIKYLLFATCVALASCATPYQRLSALTYTGGYADKDLGRDVWRVTFSANGGTSRETAQTYWLWRCSELAVEKGFDGFELLSDMRLSQWHSPTQNPEVSDARAMPVTYIPIYIPQDQGNKPLLEGDIRLLKSPLAVAPPKVFDARRLHDALRPYVEPLLKSRGNVKPHIHEYLLPTGKLTS